MKNRQVILYDTTLRDGNQDPRIHLTLRDKLSIAQLLANFGVACIEGGWPGSNHIDSHFFKKAANAAFGPKTVAFGSTAKPGNRISADPNLQALIRSRATVVTIFGKVWDYQVKSILGISLKQNLELIRDSIRFLRKHHLTVFFDAEHFFDGYKNNQDYAIECLVAAQNAGAHVIVLCDTRGGCLPHEIRRMVTAVKEQIKVPLGIHCHNDNGLAVANTMEAVMAGATQVQGTFNGYGERCGNADLVQVIPNLIMMGYLCLPHGKLTELTGLARNIAEIAGVKCQPNSPFVGKNAFCHKGGTHQHAVTRDPHTYEHIDPKAVGNRRAFTHSNQIGRAYAYQELARSGLFPNLKGKKDPIVGRAAEAWKKRAAAGYRFDLAPDSALLAAHRLERNSRPPFRVKDFNVSVRGRHIQAVSLGDMIAGRVNGESEAVVEMEVWDGKRYLDRHEVGKGDGPVNALDLACRKALEPHFPVITEVKLSDFRVRVLPGKRAGTAAQVSVIIESANDGHSWRTVGVSENIILASLLALLGSYEFAIWQKNFLQKK